MPISLTRRIFFSWPRLQWSSHGWTFVRSSVEDKSLHTLVRSNNCCVTIMSAVPWLRRLVAGISPQRTGFAPGSVRVGFVVDKVALGQAFLWVLWFSPVNINPPELHTHIPSGGWTTGPWDAEVQTHRLTPPTLTTITPMAWLIPDNLKNDSAANMLKLLNFRQPKDICCYFLTQNTPTKWYHTFKKA
jgi:hypothetical protein